LNVRAILAVALLGRFETCPYIFVAGVSPGIGVFGGCLMKFHRGEASPGIIVTSVAAPLLL
jgi:hypothetical protein